MKKKTIVILSGGQDSTTCLFYCLNNPDIYGDIHAITFDYGQRHSSEIEAAIAVVNIASRIRYLSHEVIRVPECLISSSPLTSANELERYESVEQMDAVINNRRELTFVPMRNPLFLTIAANRAEAHVAERLVIGVCENDLANYDDCRGFFLNAMEAAINFALGRDHRLDGAPWLAIDAPLLKLDKAKAIKLALSLPHCVEALAHTQTGYDGNYPPLDKNHANVLRAHGFLMAGVPDPLVIRAWQAGLMKLPDTSNYNRIRVLGPNKPLDQILYDICNGGLELDPLAEEAKYSALNSEVRVGDMKIEGYDGGDDSAWD